MRTHRNRSVVLPLAVIWIVGLVTGSPLCSAQDRGVCVTAISPKPFTFPDGSVHAAGPLTLCLVQALNPVVGLHRVFAEGDVPTFSMSRRARSEEGSDHRPVIVFRSFPGQPLELVGYTVSQGIRSWTYALKRSQPNGFAEARRIGATRGAQAGSTLVALQAE